ncbi:MAG: LysR family transcriptional regulator [Lachnospiraceae bacterium]|nr:LysR family transcriptional regulator [Lachnospiraceae bacterium]
MTLQQLKYVITVAETGSITEAARKLFISQPSLSSALKEIEQEAKITIFHRNRNGATLTDEGMEFAGYARQVIQQMDLLEAKYVNNETEKQRFCVSTQHYTFTANAFVEMVQKFGQDKYEFILNETKTHQIIEDVKNRFCDVGILFLSEANRDVLTKIFADGGMEFHPLLSAKPHVFLNKTHPLAKKEEIILEELKGYPRLNFIQGAYESSNFSEEILSTEYAEKSIKVSDRAAIVNLMIGLDAYTISSGIYPKYLHGDSIVSVPLAVSDVIEIGYLINKGRELSPLAQIYIEELRKYQ